MDILAQSWKDSKGQEIDAYRAYMTFLPESLPQEL